MRLKTLPKLLIPGRITKLLTTCSLCIELVSRFNEYAWPSGKDYRLIIKLVLPASVRIQLTLFYYIKLFNIC